MSSAKESVFMRQIKEKDIRPPLRPIIFMGHTLEPIAIHQENQEDIIRQAKQLAQHYEHIHIMTISAIVDFTDQIVRLLFQTTHLPDTARLNTSIFYRKLYTISLLTKLKPTRIKELTFEGLCVKQMLSIFGHKNFKFIEVPIWITYTRSTS